MVSGLLGEKFNLEIIVPQISKKSPKIPEGLPVLLLVVIVETQNNMEDRGSMDSMVELNNRVIHPREIPDQH